MLIKVERWLLLINDLLRNLLRGSSVILMELEGLGVLCGGSRFPGSRGCWGWVGGPSCWISVSGSGDWCLFSGGGGHWEGVDIWWGLTGAIVQGAGGIELDSLDLFGQDFLLIVLGGTLWHSQVGRGVADTRVLALFLVAVEVWFRGVRGTVAIWITNAFSVPQIVSKYEL